MRLVGGGDYYLSKSNGVRVKMTPIVFRNVAPLLESQSYIRKVELYRGGSVTYDFDLFRALLANKESLAEMHLKRFGLPKTVLNDAWLTIEPNVVTQVIINRTGRYQNVHFPWKTVIDRYRQSCAFVGTSEEWSEFVSLFGTVPFFPTANLYELAKVISGAKLFIGNQSTPFAIAEGLKKSVIQEVCLWCPNCVFPRNNAQYVAGERIELPKI